MTMVWILSAGTVSIVAVAAAVVLTPVMRPATVAVLAVSVQLLTTVMVVLGRAGQVRPRDCGLHLMRLVLIVLVVAFVGRR